MYETFESTYLDVRILLIYNYNISIMLRIVSVKVVGCKNVRIIALYNDHIIWAIYCMAIQYAISVVCVDQLI